uniref:Alpha/beta hydrolase fold-3 domain-containing protein n=1 Tax=Zooxanthella nutricula TaxID=1333877 RepID=A0A7S2IRN4_9DINO
MMYPMVDPTCSSASWSAFEDLPSNPGSWLRWSWKALLSGGQDECISEDKLREASLFHIDWSNLKGLKALVLVADFDTLKDEGSDLGKRLDAAGLDTRLAFGQGSHCLAHKFDDAAGEASLDWWREVLCEEQR